MSAQILKPRTFFLNEQHELAREKQGGGGALPQYVEINWASKGRRISRSLAATEQKLKQSTDPLRDQRRYFMAIPVAELKKASAQKKKAPDGTFEEETDFAKEHGKVFGRLGLDLIEVTDAGQAIVHARPERFEQLNSLSGRLGDLGPREQARWATVDSFDVIPPALRVDGEWLNSLSKKELADAVIELQPLLTRVEVEIVMRALASELNRNNGERLTGTGTDFSGRQWVRGKVSLKSLRGIAEKFFSVQSLHPPLYSLAAQARSQSRKPTKTAKFRVPAVVGQDLPTIALVDTGIPSGHPVLRDFRRGQYVAPDVTSGPGTHGALVASRLVFGEVDLSDGLGAASDIAGDCQFLDANVAGGAGTIHDKSVFDALRAIVGTYPDVRVFNFSFAANQPLGFCEAVQRRERMITAQDLDNFIFENDVVVTVAAGNSPSGMIPDPPYPDHIDDANWKLGHWASGFNTMVCGSCIGDLTPNGMVKAVGWPSPFTRIGPGIADAPVPGFCANGGNRNDRHTFEPGLGVWVCSNDGRWEDHSGTSFAAPLLARQAAFAFQELQKYCQQDTRPFSATVKAFLALTAKKPYDEKNLSPSVAELCNRTLGRGCASADRLREPTPQSAIYLWQGVLDSPADTALIQCPIPLDWYNRAMQPMLRVILAADVPVNEAVHNLWACRELFLRLRTGAGEHALSPLRTTKNHRFHPITERIFDLRRLPNEVEVGGDMWLLDVHYKEIADYHSAIDFSPQQRCAFALEIYDASEDPVSPQAAVQSLPLAAAMNRLSVQQAVVRSPVILKSRG